MPRKPRFRNIGAGKGIKAQLDPETLEKLHVRDRLTLANIAEMYGCTPQFVSLLVREYAVDKGTPPADRKKL